ncbi:MerC domain-containing protein [Verrucomicrobiaceae bacterium 227]
MNIPNTTVSSPPALQKADRVGIAASILCAIHCGIAPILLLALPNLGRVWAHPASHLLVAIFVVPLAVFSIRNGYRAHQKRWILIAASIGILFVLIGAILPALSKSKEIDDATSIETHAELPVGNTSITSAVSCDNACAEGCCSLTESKNDTVPIPGCVDNCCPSLQVDESGKTSLHIPPAAIVTTLGGLFLIVERQL